MSFWDLGQKEMSSQIIAFRENFNILNRMAEETTIEKNIEDTITGTGTTTEISSTGGASADGIGQAAVEPVHPEAVSGFGEILETLKASFTNLGTEFIEFIPKLIVTVIIICIGIILAKIFKVIFTKFFQSIKIDSLAEKAGISETLGKLGIRGGLSTILPKIIWFMIMIFMVKQAAVYGGFNDISAFIGTLFSVIPKVVIAFLIMAVGLFVGDLIQKAVYNAADAKGLDYAGSLSKIVFALVFIVFLTVSLGQVGIETDLLKSTVKVILLGIALALAIALGLGLKDHAANIVAAVYVRDIFRSGTEIEIDGKNLKVMGVGPVTTKLQREDGEFVVLPNSQLVTSKVKGKISV